MTATTLDRESAAPQKGRELFGHPRGLYVLAGTELWDRISFHGMQALLTLYMAEQLFQPDRVRRIVGFAGFRTVVEAVFGHLTVQGLATQVFGLYIAFAYVTPLLGGWLGDQVLGRRRAVVLGGLLMTCGHFCMAFDQSFLLALLFLIFGAGIFRSNLIPQVGALYDPDDRRRGVAFQLYASMINFGAFIAPLVTGALKVAYGWHFAFGFAGVGMLTGLIVYLLGQGQLPAHTPQRRGQVSAPLTRAETWAMARLGALVPVAALFWIAQSQVWNTYNLWARDHMELQVGAFTMPVPWLQSLDGLSPFFCLPPMLMFWAWQAKRGREPGDFTKMAIGCFIFGASTMLLAAAGLILDSHGRTPLLLAVAFHLSSNLGWLYFVPTITGFFAKAAPRAVTGTMIGVYNLSVFAGSIISGRMGSFYETMSPGAFWTLHAALVGLGGVIFLLVGWRFARAYVPTAPGGEGSG